MAEVEVTLARQVDQPAGRAHDDLDAVLQGLDLRLVGPAAVHAQHAHAEALAGLGEVGGDLDAQLAGRDDDEGLRLALTGSGCDPKPSSSGATSCISSGMPKPSVLPVPVLACPIRSWPARASGRVSSWIGNAVWIPSAASASTIAGSTPSSANVLGWAGASAAMSGSASGSTAGMVVWMVTWNRF